MDLICPDAVRSRGRIRLVGGRLGHQLGFTKYDDGGVLDSNSIRPWRGCGFGCVCALIFRCEPSGTTTEIVSAIAKRMDDPAWPDASMAQGRGPRSLAGHCRPAGRQRRKVAMACRRFAASSCASGMPIVRAKTLCNPNIVRGGNTSGASCRALVRHACTAANRRRQASTRLVSCSSAPPTRYMISLP